MCARARFFAWLCALVCGGVRLRALVCGGATQMLCYPLHRGGFIGVKQIFKIRAGGCRAASKTAKIKNPRPKNAQKPEKSPRKTEKIPQNNPEGRKKDGKKCRPFSFYTANCEQTVNERNFQIFAEKMEKCEKMKIIFTFHPRRSGSHKIFKIFNRTLVCTKKSKNLLKCVDKRVFLC